MATKNDDASQVAEAAVSFVETATIAKSDTAYQLQPAEKPPPKSAFERRLVLKQDLLIIPLLALIYLVTFLDRNSYGNARLLGLQKQLKFTDAQYSQCAQLFFVGYVIFMLPANIILRSFPPYLIVGGAIVAFGTFLCCMAAATNYGTVLGLRMLIGVGQSFVQGIGMYSSLWYTRTELATRGAIYFSTATLSGAFSGLIAYAIGKNLTLEATGRSPWQWLCIIEGVIAIGFGLIVIALLPPFPDRMKNGKNWLFSREEIELAIQRTSTFNTRDSKLSWRQVWVALKDPKAWAFSFINSGFAQAVSTVGIFLPTFIASFGYTDIDAQLFSVIPYAVAFVTLPTLAFVSDKINVKAPFILVAQTLCCIGYIMLLTVTSTVAQMVAVCFVAGGMYAGVVLSVVWLGINTAGFTKRGTTWAMSEIISQLFSIMGTSIYGSSHVKGHSVVLAFLVFAMLLVLVMLAWMRRANKKRDLMLEEYAARGAIHPHLSRSLEEEYDGHINFRYTL
ncbi:retrograde regulation protein 2 [Thozetella sp. PMI_491]|nr:retrograde regulation protein 2 [Thozetella sp. PMI_491]